MIQGFNFTFSCAMCITDVIRLPSLAIVYLVVTRPNLRELFTVSITVAHLVTGAALSFDIKWLIWLLFYMSE